MHGCEEGVPGCVEGRGGGASVGVSGEVVEGCGGVLDGEVGEGCC